MFSIFISTYFVLFLSLSNGLPDDDTEFVSVTEPFAPDNFIEVWHKIIEPYVEDCSKGTGYNTKIIMNAFRTMNSRQRNIKCFVTCTFERLGLLDKNDNFVIPKMLAFPGLTQEIAETCINNFKKRRTGAIEYFLVTVCNVNAIGKLYSGSI